MAVLHESTFEYLKPTDEQIAAAALCRKAAADYVAVIEEHVPDGPDKTYLLRKFREVAMWAVIGINRNHDGSPRQF